ncbi:DMT family transporter [Streptomyces sp. TS71-3]|uniref:DMT family transporter n=1 Tax=Streptomyces sp. TS71-3 TaxID=2733862 RepID=UPI001B1EA2B8|nr:DMT family transporter [Streptomyces sp. TS71-3]GHJ40099.1 multidrug transporter [Streptomyces sp. TS71-3]
MTTNVTARRRNSPAWARVAVLALLWGSTFLWIELALRGLSPVQVTVARCALGALVLTAACYATGRRLPRGRAVWGHIAVAAFFCNALPFALFSVGQETVDSGLAGVLNATTPLWSVAIGLTAGSERGIRPARLAGLLLGFAGTLLVFAPWRQAGSAGWGALAIVAAAGSYAVAFVCMGRNLVGRGIPTLSLSAAQLLAATALSALALPAGGLSPITIDPAPLAAVCVLGVFTTGITFHLTYRIVADEGATNAAVVGYLLPVVSVTLGAVALNEALTLRVVAGMAVVLAGVAMTRHRGAASRPAPTAADAGRRSHPVLTAMYFALKSKPSGRPAGGPLPSAAAARRRKHDHGSTTAEARPGSKAT